MTRVLAISQIFPNAAEPLSAPFNRLQLAALAELCQVEVMATVLWFPGAGWLRPQTRHIPDREQISGLPVSHPRALYVPRVGRSLSASLYATSLARQMWRRRDRVDVVLGTWAYPDGCAAIALARMIGVPVVVKLHGSDINVVARLRGPRAQLRMLLPRADRVVAVSSQLAEQAAELGVAAERIRVVRNGVDTDSFYPRDRHAARRQLGIDLDRRVVLYVGHLKCEKGVLDLARAFDWLAQRMPEAQLVVVGDGDAREQLAGQLEAVGDQARLVGAVPHEQIPLWMAAADIVTLPSWNEGTPNVLIEALACGRRVVATRVGGIPDLIASADAGELVEPGQPLELAAALERGLACHYRPESVVGSSSRTSWADSARQLYDVLEEARQ